MLVDNAINVRVLEKTPKFARSRPARLQQVHPTDPHIPIRQRGVARTEADELFCERDDLIEGPGHCLAPAELKQCVGRVAIEREHSFKFGNSFLGSALHPQHTAFGVMRERVERRSCDSSSGNLAMSTEIGPTCRQAIEKRDGSSASPGVPLTPPVRTWLI